MHFGPLNTRKTSLAPAGCVLLGIIALLTGEALPQTDPFHYGVKVELVDLFASVRDGRGRFVTKLQKSDFVIYDDGKRQNIAEFSRERYPLSVLILLDTSNSMAGTKLESARKSLDQFLRHLNPLDEAMLITFRSRTSIIEGFTRDLMRIRRDLRNVSSNGSTALYDAVLMGVDQIANAHNRRRAILLISDGINTYGRAQIKDTIEVLRRRGVELFAIGMESDLPEDARDKAVTRAVLEQLTQSAGGESYMLSDSRDLARVCNSISEQMHSQYTLGYYSPRASNLGWRKIRIETRLPGLTVIPSKAGYYPSESANIK